MSAIRFPNSLVVFSVIEDDIMEIDNEIKLIIDNKDKINKVYQNNSGFIPTKGMNYSNNKVELTSVNMPKKNKIELFKMFFKRKLFTKFLTIFLAALLISISYVMQSFNNFDENNSLYYDLVYNNEPALVLRKAYDNGVAEIPISRNACKITDGEIEEIDEVYKGNNIYKLYNYTVGVTRTSLDSVVLYSKSQNVDGFMINESYGTLNCNEDFVKQVITGGNDIEVICGDKYDKDYGVVITDYLADCIIAKNYKEYPTYESILGEYKYSYNYCYINAIIKTNYKEKHNEIIEEIKKMILNPESSDNSILTDERYIHFFNDVIKYYGISYNFSSNFEDSVKDYNVRPYLTLGNVSFDNVYSLNSISLKVDIEDKYDLDENEIAMNYATYNKIFNTSYTSKDLSGFTPTTVQFSIYGNSLKQGKLIEKEFTIKKLITSITQISTENYKEFAEYDVICYSLYFDKVNGNEDLLKVAKKLTFVVETNDIDGISYVARCVSVFGNVVSIIEIVLLLCCLFYLAAVGVKTIKSNIYEIGVIKSLGGSNKDIGRIFILQNLVMGIIIVLGSVIGMYLGSIVANEILITSFKLVLSVNIHSFKIIQFYPSVVAMDLVIGLFIIVISSVLPARYLKRVKPIEILKAKE